MMSSEKRCRNATAARARRQANETPEADSGKCPRWAGAASAARVSIEKRFRKAIGIRARQRTDESPGANSGK
ncbi:MAG TPA: hypothetical protein DCY50_06670, partial [Franconibacter helveticus]|nr:hypothetical protein [Franconibacter helveticus]